MSKFFTLEKLTEWFLDIGLLLGNCLIIFLLCLFFIKISKKAVQKIFSLQAASGHFPLDERKANTLTSVTTSVIKYTFYFIAVFAILIKIGVPATSIGAVASAGSVAIGLGAKSLMSDVIAGFFILLEDQYGVSDIVTIQNITGVVEDITIRTTRIRGFDGSVSIISNGTIGTVTNMCKEYINAIVDVDIDYRENMERVLDILKNEMEHIKIIGLKQAPCVLGITGLNESAVTVRIVAQCAIKENYRVERELKLLIKKRLDNENISIPFPQRTLHIIKES